MKVSLVSLKKNNALAVLLIFVLVQSMGMKALGYCGLEGEPCGIANNFVSCCNGFICNNRNTGVFGGNCARDPLSACYPEGHTCGFFDGSCCGRLSCTGTFSGTCQ